MKNKYLLAGVKNRIGVLPDGTPLYAAYEEHARLGERERRLLSTWDGAMGTEVAVTADGRLFRQRKMWGGEEVRPERWRRFQLGPLKV